MNKIIGAFFIILGLVLIGIGVFDEIRSLSKTLISESQTNYHDGLYITSGDTISVSSESEDVIHVILNSELYTFRYNGSYYEEKESGFYIIFTDNELALYKDGEIIRTLYKK